MPNDAQQNTATQSISIALLVPSSTDAQIQRRKHFDKVGLQQLADSLKSPAGMINPILARPVGKTFEIVAGERRWQAAKLAGLETVPVTVRELDDGQVLEVQLIENLQREGLHELHEAEGYDALRKRGINADEIAKRVGKSREYVFTRLKLLALSKDAKAAFYDSKLNFSTALLVARIPGEKLQNEALKVLTNEKDPMSVREAQEYVQEKFMLRLGEAPFDTGAENLVRGALPCGRCPKNTLSAPELFGDVKAGSVGVCTDPPCFKAKTSAALDLKVAAAEKSGQKVIEGAAAKKIFPYGMHSPQGGFKKLDAETYVNGSYVKIKSLLKEGVKPTLVRIINDHSKREELVEVVPESALNKPKQRTSSSSSRSASSPKATPAQKAAAAKEETQTKLLVAVGKAIFAAAPKPFTREELYELADMACDTSFYDDTFGEIVGNKGYPKLDKLNETGLQKIIRIALLTTHLEEGDKDVVFAVAKRHGVDVKKIEASLVAPPADKKTAAAKPKKPAKKK